MVDQATRAGTASARDGRDGPGPVRSCFWRENRRALEATKSSSLTLLPKTRPQPLDAM